jgi:tRNA-splicing ligase RtcB
VATLPATFLCGATVPIAQVIPVEGGYPVKLWTDDVADNAIEQLKNTARLPFVFRHVAAMADVHLGIGATVGSVIATRGAICPAAVGVDIGCGMTAVETSLDAGVLDGKLPMLRHSIERAIPTGFDNHNQPLPGAEGWIGAQSRPNEAVDAVFKKAVYQLGTLGGGNHFVEVCVDDASKVWLMLHSGSRGVGNKIAQRHIDKAKGVMKSMFIDLPDPNLAYFAEGTPAFEEYWQDLQWCQRYAWFNRALMMNELLSALSRELGHEDDGPLGLKPAVNCHHNYVEREHHFGENVLVTRKGAIRARKGDLGIIPGSMGTGSFIVRGLGNADSFDSAPHGAGRKMSRTEARKKFTAADLAEQTKDVECRKDYGVVDEIPGAYKPIGEVIENSSDLVEVVARLKQVVCVKG